MTGLVQTLSTYWNGRTGREQSALLLLAIVLTGTVGYFGVIAPIRSFHVDARREYTAAANAYLEVMTDLERHAALDATDQSQTDTTPLRTVVGALATSRGIAIARMLPTDDGRLSVDVDNARLGDVIAWLVEMEGRHGIRAVSVSMGRLEADRTEVSLVLQRAGVRS